MQTKQFSGATIDDVLGQVRAEFGDEAVILETRNVVRGGVAGFFGKAGIEVVAADRMPGEEAPAGLDLLDTDPAPAATAVAVAPAPAALPATAGPAAPPADATLDTEAFLRNLGRHLAPEEAGPGRLVAPVAAAAPAPGAPDPERDRARAIIEAARAAVREAAADPAPPSAATAPAVEPWLDEAVRRPAEAEVVAPVAAPAPATAPTADEEFAAEVAALEAQAAAPLPAAAPPVSARLGLPATPPPAAPAVSALDMPPVPRAERPLDPALVALRAELLAAGVDERRLDSLLEGFTRAVGPFLGPDADQRIALRDYLAARLPVVRDWRPWRTGHTIALVGQSGVGKSSTALKIAGRFRAAGMQVAIIAAGGGARGPLGDRGRELGLTVVDAPDADAVAQGCRAFADRDLVIVDTPGCSHMAPADLEAVRGLVEAAAADETHLVLPAATPAGDLGDLQQAFRPLGINRVSLTKLDETRFFGGLLNAPMRIGRPLAYIADGTALPGAIAPADPRLVAALLLP